MRVLGEICRIWQRTERQLSVNDVWEIGVDVIEKYRNARAGTYLVKELSSKFIK